MITGFFRNAHKICIEEISTYGKRNGERHLFSTGKCWEEILSFPPPILL